jgi:hypothetical protein
MVHAREQQGGPRENKSNEHKSPDSQHTLTNILSASNEQFSIWSSYSKAADDSGLQ